MFEDATTLEFVYLYGAIGAWILLSFVMYRGFIFMQVQERDTPFPEENGLTPDSLYIGRGGMNGARPTRPKYSRLALYPKFFVAGFKSQRVCMSYRSITDIERIERGKRSWLLLHATHPETDKEYNIYFYNPDVDNIQAAIEEKR